MSTNPISLTETQRETIVRFVREQAARNFGSRAAAASEAAPAERSRQTESMTIADLAYGGVFVTFKSAGQLRGCMGLFGAERPFKEALKRATILALNDPRFVQNPIRPVARSH